MPLYDYQCTSCNHELEALQKISAEPLKECPSCQKPTLRKKVTAAAFRLSGSGWYETDFKTSNQKNITKKDNTATPSRTSPTSTTSNKNTSSSKTG